MQSLKVDSKGRITIGGVLPEGTTSVRIHKNTDGTINLEPMAEIPVKELWLHKNKEAMRRLKNGIAQAEAGELIEADFSKFADD